MWLVLFALRRPYTVGVTAILIIMMGILSIQSMLIDIFPVIDIPVVGVVWSYPGLSAEDMERRVNYISERAISTVVNGVSKLESQAMPGIGLLRIYFEPDTDIGAAISQITSVSSTVLRALPPGMTPPVIVQFNASNVPVAQMALKSDTLTEEKIFDYALNFIRVRLYTIPGLSLPAPYGGKSRQINIDINPALLSAKGLSSNDVVNALNASNIILPAGTARIGTTEFNVTLNSSPLLVRDFNDIPIKIVNGAPVTIGDVARVSDAYADQTNIVRINGRRASFLNILKKAGASTLDVVSSIKRAIPDIKALAPKGLDLELIFDQSKFVRDAITSVLTEALLSSILVSLMVLFFLGSWRSVIVICTSIPLAILTAVIGLKLTGNSINIMTLGGLSLAIGMLVDDATVEVENVNRNRNLGYPLTVAILHGAQQIALPAIMATLAICIVFFPVVLLTGPSRFLFTPMAYAVVFSMLMSYVLSRTLVPVLCHMLLGAEAPESQHEEEHGVRFGQRIFQNLQKIYGAALEKVLEHRPFVLTIAIIVLIATLAFVPFMVGTDFFPATDTGLMKIHFRARAGMRIEETEKVIEKIEETIREIIPKEELATINTTIGLPISYNLAMVPTENIAAMDAEIFVALNTKHSPSIDYRRKIREKIALRFPDTTLSFLPADIVSQVLNFGLSTPIDVQIESRDIAKAFPLIRELREKVRHIPGITDIALRQVYEYPTLNLIADRLRAAQLGILQRDVAANMLISLSSSSLIAPSFYVNPHNQVNYSVAVKVPLAGMASVQDLLQSPITPLTAIAPPTLPLAQGPQPQTQALSNMAIMSTSSVMNSVSHQNVQRILDLTMSVEDRDLGSTIAELRTAIASLGPLPVGVKIKIRGQNEVMEQSFLKLGLGLILAIALVYLLMAVLFQSWLDPFIILVAIPGALVGILWMLLLTGTTINVESLMGSIMAVGIAASNSILLVSFANDIRLEKNLSPLAAAMAAGKTRLRPVLMTAIAMILGILPAALGLGEGGEQNAPLGRAVVGGLLMATLVTLFIVPVVYSLLRKQLPTKHLLDERMHAEAPEFFADLAPKVKNIERNTP